MNSEEFYIRTENLTEAHFWINGTQIQPKIYIAVYFAL